MPKNRGVGEEEVRRIDKGAIFCQVEREKHKGQLIEFITEGNQK